MTSSTPLHDEPKPQRPYAAPAPTHDIQRDPFVLGLKQRLPVPVRESFSDEQLEALRGVFGARQWSRHTIDLRGTLRLWRRRYYFVLLAGQNRRGPRRAQEQLSFLARVGLVSLLVLIALLLGVGVLYLLKSALGLDLFPNLSLGLWDGFRALFSKT